jgi:hypothetical protein
VLQLRMVILAHESPSLSVGRHYDLLIESAKNPGGMLKAFRMGCGSWEWGRMGRVELTALADHRRVYLRREGVIGGGRGWVRRVDEGRAWVWMWRQGRWVLQVETEHFRGRMEGNEGLGERRRTWAVFFPRP